MANQTGTLTAFFADEVKNIYEHIGKDTYKVARLIHKEFVSVRGAEYVGSPIDTGALRSNWRIGTHPNSSFNERVDGSEEGKERIDYPAAPTPGPKRSGRHLTYYVWNNTPYLQFVNNGDVYPNRKLTPEKLDNVNFIERGIQNGVAKAKLNA